MVSFCSGWEGKWVCLVFLFWAADWRCSGYGTGMFLRLRYSTGRGCSLKSELGEVMGGEGVRFLEVGGNGKWVHDLEVRVVCRRPGRSEVGGPDKNGCLLVYGAGQTTVAMTFRSVVICCYGESRLRGRFGGSSR